LDRKKWALEEEKNLKMGAEIFLKKRMGTENVTKRGEKIRQEEKNRNEHDSKFIDFFFC
jgi:hypothetical protein